MDLGGWGVTNLDDGSGGGGGGLEILLPLEFILGTLDLAKYRVVWRR